MSEKHYAQLRWVAEDILEIRPEWTKQQAEEWLACNERRIQERTCELGWEVIECLLPPKGGE